MSLQSCYKSYLKKMSKDIEKKIVIVKRKSRLDELIARFNSLTQTKFYVEHLGVDFADYENEHNEYQVSIDKAIELASNFGRVHLLERGYVPNFIFGPEDIVIAIGQDGMVANTLKYLTGQPLIGVNPSPNRWDGVLLPFVVSDLANIIPETFRGKRPLKEVTIASVKLNDNQKLLAVNDFFIGQKTHISARYEILFGQKSESQSSSGIIVSTGLGSTGWLKSVVTGAKGVSESISKNDASQTKKISTTIENRKLDDERSDKRVNDKIINERSDRNSQNSTLGDKISWDSDYLYYSVREPFPSKTTGTDLIFGKVTRETPLKIISHMSENGVIFSDGIESDFLEFNSGMQATIGISDQKGFVVI